MTDSPAIAPGPPPPDPMGKIDPAAAVDNSGCYPGCLCLSVALWAAPMAILTGVIVGASVSGTLGWLTFLALEVLAAAGAAWAGSRWANTRRARRRIAIGGGVTAALFLAGAIALFIAAEQAKKSDEFLAGLTETMLAVACLFPAAGGAAIGIGTVVFADAERLPDDFEANDEDAAAGDS